MYNFVEPILEFSISMYTLLDQCFTILSSNMVISADFKICAYFKFPTVVFQLIS